MAFQWTLAAAWCLLITGPMTLIEIAPGAVAACTLIRIRWTWPLCRRLAKQSLPWMMVSVGLWAMLSLLWTQDRRQGWMDVADFRWLALLPALTPALDRRGLLIRCIAISIIGVAAAQWAIEFGLLPRAQPWLWSLDPDRNAAWFQPVVGGSMLVAGLGLHLPAMLAPARPREFAMGLLGVAACGAGIMLTGSRGAWFAAVLLVLVGCSWAGWRLVGRRSGVNPRTAIGAAAAALLVIGLALWSLAGPAIERRFNDGIAEIRAGLEHGDYTTNTARRILMAQEAWRAFSSHPIVGVGVGDYGGWANADAKSRGIDAPIHPHAHSAPLHIAATLGLVGLLLAGACAWIAARSELRRLGGVGPDHPHPYAARPGYSAGPAFGLLGLALASLTDVVHMNTQTCALMVTLMLLCLPVRPRPIDEPTDSNAGGAT